MCCARCRTTLCIAASPRPPLLCAAGLRRGGADRARGHACAVCGAADGGIFRGSARASSKRHALAEYRRHLLRHRQQRRPSGPEESKRQERTGCIACAASGKCQGKGYADGSGYEARFTQCGICTLMKKLGLYDLTPAMCHLDYTMSEAGGASNFVREYTLASGGPHCDCGYQKRS